MQVFHEGQIISTCTAKPLSISSIYASYVQRICTSLFVGQTFIYLTKKPIHKYMQVHVQGEKNLLLNYNNCIQTALYL